MSTVAPSTPPMEARAPSIDVLQWSQWISGTEIVSVTITQAPHMSEALQGLASYPLGVSAASPVCRPSTGDYDAVSLSIRTIGANPLVSTARRTPCTRMLVPAPV